MTARDEDLALLGELVDGHAGELTATESDAFEDMRLDLLAYGAVVDEHSPRGQRELTERQRAWARSVRERFAPTYQNLVSSGQVPRGREVPLPQVLRDLPKRPPTRWREGK